MIQKKEVTGRSRTGKMLTSSARGRAAIVACFAVAATTLGYHSMAPMPPSVVLATNTLIKPWEGLQLKSHWDRYASIWDICYGETRINGKPVQANMSFTAAECEEMLKKRVYNDYYLPLVKRIPSFSKFPVSVQAVMISGSYNFGVGGMISSSAATHAIAGRYREACEAQTAWNRAGGEVVKGLVRRREMGDAQRLGEAELCLSGL